MELARKQLRSVKNLSQGSVIGYKAEWWSGLNFSTPSRYLCYRANDNSQDGIVEFSTSALRVWTTSHLPPTCLFDPFYQRMLLSPVWIVPWLVGKMKLNEPSYRLKLDWTVILQQILL